MKLCKNREFAQNFHTKKLGEITVISRTDWRTFRLYFHENIFQSFRGLEAEFWVSSHYCKPVDGPTKNSQSLNFLHKLLFIKKLQWY